MSVEWGFIIQILSAVVLIGAAGAVIVKFIAPAMRINARISEVERRQKIDYDTMTDMRKLSGLLCRGMMCLIEHEVTGNGIIKLKEVKEDMQDYLIKRGS